MWPALAILALVMQPPAPAGPAFRVTLPADLDCTKAAAEFEGVLAEAHAVKASKVVVELGGNASREHVVHRIAAALRACDIDTEAWITDDGDRTVGMGQLVIAQFADRVIVDRRVHVRGVPMRPAATETMASKSRDEELREWLAGVLERREAPAGDRELLLGPVVECRVAGEPATLRFGPAPSGVPVVERGTSLTKSTDSQSGISGTREWSIPGSALGALRLAQTPRAWPPKLPVRVTERRISTTAATELVAARAGVDRIDRAIAAADDALDLPDPSRRDTARSRYRDGAARANVHVAAAIKDASSLEALLASAPEVMESPAPGQGEGASAASCAARWRSVVSSRRDRAERVRLKAERFAAMRD